MSAVDETFHTLREAISAGRYAPGERLPTEAVLCAELGVSRSSLREAVRMLVALGVLDNRPGAGASVSRLRAEDVLAGLSLTVDLLPLTHLLGLYELRRLLEGHAAAQAAARGGADLVEELQQLRLAMETSEVGSEITSLDHEFHAAVGGACGNPAVQTLLSVLRGRSRDFQLFDLPVGPEVKRRSDEGHRAIAEAIAQQDPVAAQVAAAEHVAQTERWLRAHLDELAARPPRPT